MAAQEDNNHSQQRIKELEDEIQNYHVYYRYVIYEFEIYIIIKESDGFNFK